MTFKLFSINRGVPSIGCTHSARTPPRYSARMCTLNVEHITTLPNLRTAPLIATRTLPLSILGTPLINVSIHTIA